MTFRKTSFLILLAAGLFAFIYFYESRQPGRDGAGFGSPRMLKEFDASAVNGVEITRSNFVIRAVKTNDAWRLALPSYPAQSTGVEAFIASAAKASELLRITARDLQNEGGGLKAYGLEPPAASITFQGPSGRVHLNIGNKTPMANQIYAQLVGVADIFVTESELLKHLPESPDEWRDPRLLEMSAIPFDRVRVASGSKNFEIRRDPTNLQWRISRPLPGRADSNRVDELLVRLQTTRISRFVRNLPVADLDQFGLQTPIATLSLDLGTNTLAAIEFGKSPTNDATQVYARNPAYTNVMLIPRDLLDFIQQPYKNFHDPRVLGFPPASITAIQVRAAESFDIEKRGAKWFVTPANFIADTGLVGAMLTNSANLEILDIESELPSDSDLAQRGFSPSKRQFTYMTSSPAAAGATTNQTLVQVSFGASQLDIIYARRSDEAAIYKTPLAAVEELPVQAFQVRDRRLWSLAPTTLTNVTLIASNVTNSLTRVPGGSWASDDIFNAAADEIFFKLTLAQTPRWVAKGEQKAKVFGLESPSANLRMAAADGLVVSVSFGGRTPRANVYASYIPAGETERIIFEFPGPLYQDLLRLMTPNPTQ